MLQVWKLELKEVKWLVYAIEPRLDFKFYVLALASVILNNSRLCGRIIRDPLWCRWFWLWGSKKGYSSHPLGLLEIPTYKQGLILQPGKPMNTFAQAILSYNGQVQSWNLEDSISFCLLTKPEAPVLTDSGRRIIFEWPVLSGQPHAARSRASLDLYHIMDVPELWRALTEWSSVLREVTLNSFSQSLWPQPQLPQSLYTEWYNR